MLLIMMMMMDQMMTNDDFADHELRRERRAARWTPPSAKLVLATLDTWTPGHTGHTHTQNTEYSVAALTRMGVLGKTPGTSGVNLFSSLSNVI